ncbi:monocarboxylate transporter 9-like [Ischnura elegans]|uniref:monocarboxylate transporter 9-like n=1 Tax=Ischnura elegans TaxID=197161 RepID=UPI001ED89A4F|nr:monocarboxylate transporter 9-like [Ischnura elegans]
MARSGAASAENGKNTKGEPMERLREFIPPDGGYGWVIVFASGMTNFFTLALVQNFGLIYRDSLKKWDINNAQYSVILNLQFSICNCLGLIMGPLLRAQGYRKVSFWGSVMICVSAALTSQVNEFYLFLIVYSVVGGAGVGFVWSSTSLAINTYFKERRGVATGIAWAATGLSPVVFPQFLTWLRTEFDVHGTVLITAGIMMHSIPASLLLHPIERHAEFKSVGDDEDDPEKAGSAAAEEADECKNLVEASAVRPVEVFGGEEAFGSRRSSFRKRHSLPHAVHVSGGDIIVDTQDTLGLDIATPISLHSSRVSLDKMGSTNLRRTVAHSDFVEALEEVKLEQEPSLEVIPEISAAKHDSDEGKNLFCACMKRVADYLDLALLNDFRFLMIFIGMTLAYCGEINFSLLASLVFLDYGFSLEKVAMLMSTLAFVDLVTRFCVPFFSDHYKLDSLVMYSIGLIFLGTGRIMLAHLDGYITILCVSAWLGLGKGFRTIYMALVMPSIVPLDKLASASGLQTMANGISFLIIGPLFGYMRDNSDNFVGVLYAIDLFTAGAIIVWILEVVCRRNRKRKEAKKEKNAA